jgi:glycosyltransferase involved in cell wall biosynthesis
MPDITVIISTLNNRFLNVVEKYNKCKFDCLVIHQACQDSIAEALKFADNYNFRYIPLNTRGVSKSRNFGLLHCATRYACIMDDDVVINYASIDELSKLMDAENVDVATGKYEYFNGEFPKKYKDKPFLHNMVSATKVSSIEICVNVESLKRHDLKFDENFGLGSKLPSGEEYIFLTDCLKSGLKVKYYPILIGAHPEETSGMDFYSSFEKTLAKRKMFQRVFGWKSLFFIVAFWVSKAFAIRSTGYFWSFTKVMLFGTR